MKQYFHMFGVATPANHVAGYAAGDTTAPYVKFHNDAIKVIVTGLDSNRIDPNTEHNYEMSYDAHDFYNSYMTAQNTKTDIFNFILNQITAHNNAPSQWQTDQELNKNTKEYRITVKHKFDSGIVAMDGIEVYPFAVDKKLYPLDPNNPDDKQYVKASCGGTKILDADIDEWENKKENEIYYLEGTGGRILSSIAYKVKVYIIDKEYIYKYYIINNDNSETLIYENNVSFNRINIPKIVSYRMYLESKSVSFELINLYISKEQNYCLPPISETPFAYVAEDNSYGTYDYTDNDHCFGYIEYYTKEIELYNILIYEASYTFDEAADGIDPSWFYGEGLYNRINIYTETAYFSYDFLNYSLIEKEYNK